MSVAIFSVLPVTVNSDAGVPMDLDVILLLSSFPWPWIASVMTSRPCSLFSSVRSLAGPNQQDRTSRRIPNDDCPKRRSCSVARLPSLVWPWSPAPACRDNYHHETHTCHIYISHTYHTRIYSIGQTSARPAKLGQAVSNVIQHTLPHHHGFQQGSHRKSC